MQALVLERFSEHVDLFRFRDEIITYCENLSPVIINIANLMTLGLPIPDSDSSLCEDTKEVFEKAEAADRNINDNSCSLLEGIRDSPNVINLSKRNLSDAEISLLSKGLKFVPTPSSVNKARIKEELEIFCRKLRLKWHFRNDEREITINPFQKKSKFTPKRSDAAIEIYLSRLEEEILNIDTRLNYSNLNKEERKALYSLRDHTSIIIKEADKGSGIVVWDRDDYLEEAKKQLDGKEVYKKVNGEVEGPLIKLIKGVLGNVRKRGDISDKTLDYFLVNNPKLGRFYLLPKIHKRLHDVPGRPVISNSSYYTENISSFVEFHLKPLAQKVQSYIKDTNDFLKKLCNFLYCQIMLFFVLLT